MLILCQLTKSFRRGAGIDRHHIPDRGLSAIGQSGKEVAGRSGILGQRKKDRVLRRMWFGDVGLAEIEKASQIVDWRIRVLGQLGQNLQIPRGNAIRENFW